jgi:hypothetical protein
VRRVIGRTDRSHQARGREQQFRASERSLITPPIDRGEVRSRQARLVAVRHAAKIAVGAGRRVFDPWGDRRLRSAGLLLASSAKLVEELLRPLQISGVKPLREAPIGELQEIARFFSPILLPP